MGNEKNDTDIGTAISNDSALIDYEVKFKIHETDVTNENAETNQSTVKMKCQHESEITNDENDDLNDNEESRWELSSENNEATSYPSNKGQIIRQHKFYIHGAWLALQSSYFHSLFFSGMKESNAKEVHVQISTSEEQAHLMLLEAMYKIDTLDKANVDELLEVLRLAHKYDVKFVFKKCKYCLQAAVDSLEICEQIMHFIKTDFTITDVEDILGTLKSFLVQKFSPLDKTWQTTSFEQLCEPSLKYLLSSDELYTESENTVFHALMHWVEERGIENVLESQKLPSLLSVVRFEFISIDYLYNNVQHHSVAKKFPDFNDYYLRGLSYHALPEKTREILPHQPVKRGNDIVFFYAANKYTWVIQNDTLDALVGTDKKFKSDTFWHQGYGMVLGINKVQKLDNYTGGKQLKRFNANLSLEIINLKQHSVVDITWHSSYSNDGCTNTYNTTHTFKNGAHISSVKIRYVMKVRPNLSSPCLSIDVNIYL